MEKFSFGPARWIWMPAQRTLPNTFVMFIKDFELAGDASGGEMHILADSRYVLWINGREVGRGPAPADPRWPEVDSYDVTAYLCTGANHIAALAMWYGASEGTYVLSNPGLCARLDIQGACGTQTVGTGADWLCRVQRAHRPGMHAQWFLRALQEEYDARLEALGWNEPGYVPGHAWRPAAELPIEPDKPTLCQAYDNGVLLGTRPDQAYLLKRMIPPMEYAELPMRLRQSGRLQWTGEVQDWFDFRMEGCFEIWEDDRGIELGLEPVTVEACGEGESRFLTFCLPMQVTGHILLDIDAPEGTVVELMAQEAHDKNDPRHLWLDTHYHNWQRLICVGGENRFCTFEYFSFRWVQLHIHGNTKPVTVRRLAAKRRVYPFRRGPNLQTGDAAIDRVLAAQHNNILCNIQEINADGCGRERQQYSGDMAHQVLPLYSLYGEYRLPGRYIKTYSDGAAPEGYYMDCWPAGDRLARMGQRQYDATAWGPILDHGVQFALDVWAYWMHTADKALTRFVYPRLCRFEEYLAGLAQSHGFLPVEDADLKTPSVYLDFYTYAAQRHKTCAFNLYAAAMLKTAMAPLHRLFGSDAAERQSLKLAGVLEAAMLRRFWDAERQVYVDNLPWVGEEGGVVIGDRTLANALLFGQCPAGQQGPSLELLARPPGASLTPLGLDDGAVLRYSYPPNQFWRHMALAKAGRVQPLLDELRLVWATNRAVLENNTLPEFADPSPDGTQQWSHGSSSPMNILVYGAAGFRVLEPGGGHVLFRPSFGDLPGLSATFHTAKGPIDFRYECTDRGQRLCIALPEGVRATVEWAGQSTSGAGQLVLKR